VRPVVFLAYGQSIASNLNEATYQPTHLVYSIDAGHCYEARDPMRGADGTRGSMWSWLGDALPASRFPVIAFVTIGVGGSSIVQWDVGGDLNPKLTDAVDALHRGGFSLPYLLWHQGSADRGMAMADYMAHFRSMIASLSTHGVQAGTGSAQTRVLIAVHTICNSTQDPAIAAAQRALVDNSSGSFSGADTDTIGPEQRFDGCHLNQAGQNTAAGLWRAAIEAAADYPPPRP